MCDKLVPTWKTRSASLRGSPSMTEPPRNSSNPSWRSDVFCFHMFHVFSFFRFYQHQAKSWNKILAAKNIATKNPGKLKMTWKGQDFSIWWLHCRKSYIQNIRDKLTNNISEDGFFRTVGPEEKNAGPNCQKYRTRNPTSNDLRSTWLFIKGLIRMAEDGNGKKTSLNLC